MAACYMCTVRDDPSPVSSAIGVCSTCGVLTCVYDGARVHATARFTCAMCLVRVLIESAVVSSGPHGPSGPGGGGATMAAVRAYLSTDDFERSTPMLARRSEQHRHAWRELLTAQLPAATARRFAGYLDDLVGGAAGTAEKVESLLLSGTAGARRLGLLADATGVGEYAHDLKAGEAATTLANLEADAQAAQRAEEALKKKLDAESTMHATTGGTAIGAQPVQEQEAKETRRYRQLGGG